MAPEPTVGADPPISDRVLYTGICTGGPYADRVMNVRYPEGFLAVDRAAGTCVVYTYDPAARTFAAGEPEPVDEGALAATVDETRFDVVAS